VTSLHPLLEGEPRRHLMLRLLHEHRAGGMRVVALTKACGAGRSGLSSDLNRLEVAGLIRRIQQANRSVVVMLTPAGSAQLPLLPQQEPTPREEPS
jgi:DNA-binding MarR family transcriptional regulator